MKPVDLDITLYHRESLASMGHLVADAIRRYQDSVHIDDLCDSQRDAQAWAVRQLMRLTRGHMNPETAMILVRMERRAYRPETILECV